MRTKLKIMTLACAGIAAALILSVSSCVKGDKGPKGDTGTPGTNGVANITSFTLNAPAGSWTHVGTAGQAGDGYMVSYSIPALTSQIISDGAVMCYYVSGSTIGALPWTFSVYQNISSTLYFEASPGTVKITMSDSDFNTLAPTGSMLFKLVLIPPALIKKNPDVDLSDYNKVKAAFQIVD